MNQMTKEIKKDDQPQAPATSEKKKSKKRWIVTGCVAAAFLLGAGGTAGVMSLHGHGHGHEDRIEARQLSKAKVSSIKVDQQKAIDQFNQKYAGKQISAVKLEVDHGKYVYEVKGFDGKYEYEVEINAQTGKQIKAEREKLDQGEKEYALDPAKAISRDEASSIAEKAAKKGQAREWKLTLESKGQAVWKVKVADGSKVKKVTIDAATKKVLKTEVDH